MTDEELVKLYQDGDNSALDELLEQKKNAVYRMAKRYYFNNLPYCDEDDLIQEAYLAIIKAATKYRFDVENSAPFGAYMSVFVERIVLNAIRQGRKKIDDNKCSIDVSGYEDDNETMADSIPCKENQYVDLEECLYNKELRRKLEDIMKNNLTLQERQVIKYTYGWDGDIAPDSVIRDYLGISVYLMEKIRSSALYKLKNNEGIRAIAKEFYGERYDVIQDTFKALELENLKNKWMV